MWSKYPPSPPPEIEGLVAKLDKYPADMAEVEAMRVVAMISFMMGYLGW
jgi:hypothetical protein